MQNRFPNEVSHEGPTGKKPVIVFYDGGCHLCSMEIKHYVKLNSAGQINFIDISRETFDPKVHGVDPVRVQKEMHAIDSAGNLKIGVDAFTAIWDVLPRYRFVSRVARNSFVRPFLDVAYFTFSKIRPYLPRKNVSECDSGTCQR